MSLEAGSWLTLATLGSSSGRHLCFYFAFFNDQASKLSRYAKKVILAQVP